ncbi:protein SRC2 homolog [Mercurialis annua]|uniref:protein SRC2 homolog n=1 Tax=Mercurialis annua TaxID=3986 RepID=UPI00215F6C53|nr:protein SRC2 homolog [Mercurialis annua]
MLQVRVFTVWLVRFLAISISLCVEYRARESKVGHRNSSASSMESKSMELKVMYCQDLKAFNFFQKLLVYVLVSIVSEDPEKKLKQNHQQRTPTDTEDDGNPEWNHEMQFDLSEVSFVDCDHLFVHFDLRHEGLYFGDKTIGEVRVPLKDMIQESCGITRFLNYQVKSPEGKPNGILNFSCKINAKREDMGIHSPTSEITGYSVIVQHHHHHHHHPTSEAESSSPRVHYPSLNFESSFPESNSAVQVSYPTLNIEHETLYPPYPPPLAGPPPPPLPHQSPPSFLHGLPPPLQPPPPPQGPLYHSPYPPEFRPFVHGEVYGYSAYGNWSEIAGHSHSFGHAETRRHEYRAYWNGR